MHPQKIWTILSGNLSSAKSYIQHLRLPLGSSLAYFGIVLALLGLVVAVRFQQRTLPEIISSSQATLEEAIDNYPAELEIRWSGQELLIEPDISQPIPYPTFEGELPTELPENLAYIDSRNLSPEEIGTDSLFILTKDELFVSDERGGWTDFKLTEILEVNQPFVINQDTLPFIEKTLQTGLSSVLNFLGKAVFVLIPLWMIISGLWMALIEGFLVFLLLKINQINLDFKKTFQLSLHLVVVATLITHIAEWLYPRLQAPMFSLTYWLVLIYILWTQRKSLTQLAKSMAKSTGGKGRSS